MPVQMGGNISIQPLPPQISGTQQPGGGSQVPAFADYSSGDTLQAQVTGVSGKMITMETPQGVSVQAQFPEGVVVNPGDLVDVTLVSKNNNMVHLKLDSINGQNINLESSDLQVYLMENGIAPSKMNEAAAQVLMRANINPTPKNVAQLVQVATQLPELPTSIAVMMAQNNIPPTQENANILMKWGSEPAAMGQDIQNLSGLVQQETQVTQFTQVFQDNVLQQATPEQAQILQNNGNLEQLTQNLGNQLQQLGLENMTPKQAQAAIHEFVAQLPIEGDQAAALESLLTNSFTQASETVRSEGAPQPLPAAPEQAQPQPAAANQAPAVPENQGNPAPAQVGLENAGQIQTGGQPVGGQGTPVNAAPDQSAQVPAGAQETAAAESGAQTPQAQPAEGAAKGSEPQTVRQSTAEESAVRQAPPETSTGRNETQPARQAQAVPNEQAPASEHSVRQEASQVLSNLGKMVVRVREGSVQEDAQLLREGVRDQQHIANLTKDTVARMFGQASNAAQKAGDLSAQIRLGNQIEQFYYAQIPFQTMHQEGTAELYVFQRQGQKAEAERSHVTVLIGLDTQHMGRVETILRSMEEHLSVEFRVENTRVQTYFEDSLKTFSEEMGELGFPLDSVRVTQIKEKVTPLNAMQIMEPKQEIRLRGLDIEA